MNQEEFFKSRGFSPSWLEVSENDELSFSKEKSQVDTTHRKELSVLLSELDEIKKEFEKISAKKEKLQSLLNFYTKFLLN